MQINTPHLLLDKSDTGYFDMISMHIKVHGKGTWTYQLKEYLENYCTEKNADGEAVYPIYFSRVDSRGDVNIGRLVGANNLPLVLLDGPHSAPAEHYYNYQTCMLVGAGIGLTPCSSILTSLLKYKWKKNHPTEILHFFWVVKYDELESFQWFVHLLTEISFELKKNKDNHQIERHYFLEINIYVTSVPKAGEDAIPLPPLKRPVKKYSEANGIPTFTAEQLYALLKNPKVDSRTQKEQMSSVSTAKNRLQNIWVWNGRPNWDIIFQDIKAQRQHQNIGVCFCGTPAIGADLKEMCNKYSDPLEDCIFSLNKENF
jgi:NADPH oxidase